MPKNKNKASVHIATNKEFTELFAVEYDTLDGLTKRLQDNYNNGTPFEQLEEDRLALGILLDAFDNLRRKRNDK